MICGVCNINEAIGVASTSVPYSVAYCVTCAQNHADPESVFEFFWEEVNGDATQVHKVLVTYYQGGYIDFQEWAKRKKGWTT